MPQEPKVDSVQSALADLMNLEEERIEKKRSEEAARAEADRIAREAADRKHREEEELRAREAESARQARIKAEQEDMERKHRHRELEEMELKKKLELEKRLKEDEMRFKHEEQLKTIEASAKKGFPKWGYGAIAGGLVLILGVTGIVIWQLDKKAKAEKAEMQRQSDAALAVEREKAKQRDEQINKLLGQLKNMKSESDMTAEELKEKKLLEEQIASLQSAQQGSGKKGGKGKKGGAAGGTAVKKEDYKDPLGGM